MSILAVGLYLLLVDVALETVLSGSPLRWFVAGIVAGYLAVSVVLQRRFGWGATAACSLIVLAATIALSAWLPAGLSHGIVALRQSSAVLLSAATVLAILLAAFVAARLNVLPVAGRVVAAGLAIYSSVAFALGIMDSTAYSTFFHGGSLWQRLPFWLQGPFVGALVLVPLVLTAHIINGARRVRGKRLREWAVETVVLSAGLVTAAAGAWGPREPAAEPLGLLGPELILTVNGSHRVAVMPGSPLIFRLTLRNGRAARAALAADARAQLRQDLEDQVSAGELTRQAADEEWQREPVPSAVPDISITVAPARFTFEREGPGGTTGLPWRPRVVDPPTAPAVTLDATRDVSVTFVVAPEETISTASGLLRVRAHFGNRSGSQGQGTVASNAVAITVAQPSGAAGPDRQKAQQLLVSEYFLAVKDYDRALGAVQAVLALDRRAIDASALLGEVQEAKGDFAAAMATYEQALSEFDQRYPDADQPPFGLRRSLARIRQRLGTGNAGK
jgi:hypothetical protein